MNVSDELVFYLGYLSWYLPLPFLFVFIAVFSYITAKYKNDDMTDCFFLQSEEKDSQKKVKDHGLVLSTYRVDILKTHTRPFRSQSRIYCTPSRKNNNRKTKENTKYVKIYEA